MIKKIFLSICSFFLLSSSFAQVKPIPFEIEGELVVDANEKYAYLYLNESKRLLKVAIQNRQFYFSGIDTLSKRELNFGHLFLSNDSADRYIPIREIVLKNSDRKYRSVVIENDPIKVSISGDVKYAKIEGGRLNRENDEMNSVVSEGRYEEYVGKHADSPFSLLLINTIIPLTKTPRFNVTVDCQMLYDKLSDRLKQSGYGIEVQQKIKEL